MRRVTIGLDHDKDIEHILKFALSEDDLKIFSSDISDWLTDNNCKPDKTFSDHIKLYLVVAAFDNYIRDISDSYLFLPYERKTQQELTDFLSTRFTAQQKILPSSAMGNLFGMKNDPQKGFILYRQYAFGRALMDRMPWLRLTEEGQPAGPNVLLLSGSKSPCHFREATSDPPWYFWFPVKRSHPDASDLMDAAHTEVILPEYFPAD